MADTLNAGALPRTTSPWHVGSVATRMFTVQSRGNSDVIDITRALHDKIAEAGLRSGIITVFVQGSTAALTTVEYEPGLVADLRDLFERIAPSSAEYRHHERWNDGNGHSHVRAALLGPSLTIPVVDGFLTLGSWQQVVLVDFDNRARSRELVMQAMGEFR